MPLLKGKKNISRNISEFHKGPRFAKARRKHGKKVADKMAVAVAMRAAGKRRKR